MNEKQIAKAELVSEVDYYARMLDQARPMIPAHIRNPYEAMLICGYGRRLDIPDLIALQEIVVIKGKIALSAKLQLALIRERCPQARINILQNDDKAAIVEVKRYKEDTPVTVSFTAEDAKRAGLTSGNWATYKADMLWARCVSRIGRRIFPDVTLGAYTPEDMASVAEEAAEEIEVEQVEVIK